MDTAQDSDTKKEPRVNSIPGDKLCQNILFLSDWVKVQEETADSDCPPCDIATIAPWYRDLLAKKGYKEAAAKIDALAEGEHDVLEGAEVLDEVRESIQDDEETKSELLTYDCMMQKYEGED